MRGLKYLLAATSLTVLGGTLGATASSAGASSSTSPTITIGSTNFPEQVIVANLYADVLNHIGIKTDLRANLGDREAVEPALAHGQLDLYPDYAGTLLLFLKPNDTTQATNLTTDLPALKAALAPQGATVLAPAPAIDTNVFVVTKATAAKYHLTTLSSLAPVASKLSLGAPPECPQRPTCLLGLEKVYGIHFKSFVSTDEAGPITIAALKTGRVQVAELFSSDGSVLRNGFVQLTDNKDLQPADHLIPVIRTSVDTPKVAAALNAMSAKLTTEQLEGLNIKVTDDHLDPATVASQWLASEHLT